MDDTSIISIILVLIISATLGVGVNNVRGISNDTYPNSVVEQAVVIENRLDGIKSVNAWTQDDIDYLNDMSKQSTINESKLKAEIDDLNKELDDCYSRVITTNNGIKIYLPELILKIDSIKQAIAMRTELMNRHKNKEMFVYIEYPLLSEIEHIGILEGFHKYVNTDDFFKEQLEKQEKYDKYYDSRRVDEFFNSWDEIEYLVNGLNSIEGYDLEGTVIMISPCEVTPASGYFIDHNDNKHKASRTGVVVLQNKKCNILSTTLHELGHQVYKENVENNKLNFNKYYNLYKSDFDKYNAVEVYEITWDKKLTENFAEDFKIYLTSKLGKEYINIEDWEDYVCFVGKETIYPLNDGVFDYFDGILRGYKPINETMYPHIDLKFSDYEVPFKYYSDSFAGSHLNKIYTDSKHVDIEIADGDDANQYSLISITLDGMSDSWRTETIETLDCSDDIREFRLNLSTVHDVYIIGLDFSNKYDSSQKRLEYIIYR